ncbi:unnamed protein product, partial [Brassica napus]
CINWFFIQLDHLLIGQRPKPAQNELDWASPWLSTVAFRTALLPILMNGWTSWKSSDEVSLS